MFAFVATLDRAHHFKRLDVAIDALARAGGEPPPTCSSPAAASCSTAFATARPAAGVADRVHFLGAVPHRELPGVLRAADAFVLTTEPPESFGIVLIEAMACGLPVIATDYPGVRAVVDDQTGIVVPPGDPAPVAVAIERLAGDAEARKRMGAAGRAKAEREWAWPALLDRMDAAYTEAVAERRRKTP